MTQDEIIRMAPSVQQIESIIGGLNRCNVRASAREFLCVWIRDWTAHKLTQETHALRAQLAALESELRRMSNTHDLKDIRCGCCGYMTYQSEHIGCIRAAHEMKKQAALIERQRDELLDALKDAFAVWLNEIDCEEYPHTEAKILAAIAKAKGAE